MQWQEITELEQRARSTEHQLKVLTRDDSIVQRLLRIPGIGLLTATAMRAAIVDIHRLPSGRNLACWLGVTALESSSGERRRLGRISKRGDAYLRSLLIHGARSVLNAALASQNRGRALDRLRAWPCSLNSIAITTRPPERWRTSIVWATWKYERDFDGNWAMHHEMNCASQPQFIQDT